MPWFSLNYNLLHDYCYSAIYYCAGECAPGVYLMRCTAIPCDVNDCPAYPRAECRNNYCGGCNAEFFVNNRKVDCRERGSEPLLELYII